MRRSSDAPFNGGEDGHRYSRYGHIVGIALQSDGRILISGNALAG
jgi:hypothetical protein